nr:hypothetical protein [Tanacetum cinerariifolium]
MDKFMCGNIPIKERFNINRTKSASTPEEVERMIRVAYASAIRSLNYAVRCTRTNVALAQNLTSRFQHNICESHWTAMKNIPKCLRATRVIFLVYGGNLEVELRVKSYLDLRSCKQSTTTMSATEAEYIAALEAVWIRMFIYMLGIVTINIEPMEMNCDNLGEIIISNELGVQRGSKHYQRSHDYVHECIECDINTFKVHKDDNLVDPFTKALPNGKLTQHVVGTGLLLASNFM